MSASQFWNEVPKHSVDYVKEVILTGYRKGKPWLPVTYSPDLHTTLVKNGLMDCVLDFGCGLGRNFPALRQVASRVEAFDTPGMINLCRYEAPDANEFHYDWNKCKARRYDMVLACAVFQHIPPDELDVYLTDMKFMTPALLVMGRNTFDDSEPLPTVWDYVESRGYNRELQYSTNATDHGVCLYSIKI